MLITREPPDEIKLIVKLSDVDRALLLSLMECGDDISTMFARLGHISPADGHRLRTMLNTFASCLHP